MKTILMHRPWLSSILFVVLALFATGTADAQSGIVSQQDMNTNQQTAPPEDPITQLNLTPEQRQQIRTIREQRKDDRATINARLRESRIALRRAMDAENPNEVQIEQLARELGEAQAASIRLQAVTEAKIRRVLNPEQLRILRELRAQAQDARRERQLQEGGNGLRGRGLRNQRNGILPPERRNQNRQPRP